MRQPPVPWRGGRCSPPPSVLPRRGASVSVSRTATGSGGKSDEAETNRDRVVWMNQLLVDQPCSHKTFKGGNLSPAAPCTYSRSVTSYLRFPSVDGGGGGGTGKLFSFLSSCPPTPPQPRRWRARAPLHRSPSSRRHFRRARGQSDFICATAVRGPASYLFMEPSTDAFCISRDKPANAERECSAGGGDDGVVVRLSHT